jgi:hypothetical protein
VFVALPVSTLLLLSLSLALYAMLARYAMPAFHAMQAGLTQGCLIGCKCIGAEAIIRNPGHIA